MTFKSILTSVLLFSFIFSAEAMYVYSNQAAKENVRKHEIIKQDVSGWNSVVWLISHKERVFPVDPDWKVPDIAQWEKDGLNFMSISQALDDGKLNSQEAYDELVRVNRLDEFHSKNIKYRFGQPIKIIGLIAALIFVLLLLKKLVARLKKKWKSIKTNIPQSKSISSKSVDGSMQKSFLKFSAIMLLVSIINLPYGYYTLLRLVVTFTAIITANYFYKISSPTKVVIFSFIALLFNPLIPVHLNKPLWLIIDIALAIYMYSISKSIAVLDKK
jgi:hypothetical protein